MEERFTWCFIGFSNAHIVVMIKYANNVRFLLIIIALNMRWLKLARLFLKELNQIKNFSTEIIKIKSLPENEFDYTLLHYSRTF